MAVSEETTAAIESHDQASVGGSPLLASLVICLGPAYQDATPERLESLLQVLGQTIGADMLAGRAPVLVGYPATHGDTPSSVSGPFTLLPYLQPVSAHTLNVQPAAAWLSAYELMRAHNCDCCLLLGVDAHSLDPVAIRDMIAAITLHNADLAVPCYSLEPNQGLLNAAILSPLSAGVYGVDIQFPVAIDYAVSRRMAERMATAAQRFTASAQGDALLWPVAEAAVAGFSVAEVSVGKRELPQPQDELSTILSWVAGSMFSDIEAKAAFWQRTRPVREIVRLGKAPVALAAAAEPPSSEEIDDLIQTFRIGYSNLHEIWSLVLPPNTLLGLKRLSQASSESFSMPNGLWVRTVYDFVLAHRLRTISRGHLLGALTPLYLAWVASHILANGSAESGTGPLTRSFEADKPYLVSRWRWPDRFNP